MSSRAITAAIIKAAKKEFQKHGYRKAAMDDIVRAVNAANDDADFTKKETCLNVLKSYYNSVKRKLESYEENINARQRLSLYLDEYFQDAETIAKEGNPIFNLYWDLRGQDEELFHEAEKILKLQHKWIDDQFVIILKTENVADQGNRLMAALHGLFFLARLQDDASMFKSQLIQLKSWIRSM
ncbi:TetR family transcriptional regulator [Pseudemcibacter aquimaris]|uniref:TetR family transcriptional regulator n=1 Tax=Pseudemcibacter aquimaris TaxID=2857064 RepID=UPI002013841C|nr:TetR family transcriptional regulator [Pseudemcibacter aquimaris]MCC3862369.1 TetR family transcriptional regulator [Pseudemcibacter aquimaris]WDU59200.1 TetR family transcriptional regulator [Pseudemcibacter aquimaris]